MGGNAMNEQDMKIYLRIKSLKVSVDYACLMFKKGSSLGVNLLLGQMADKITCIQDDIKKERG